MTTKAEVKHTAGPWIRWNAKRDTQAEFCIVVGIETDNGRVRIASLPDMSMIGEDNANARLIAAAPDLLEALNRLMVHFFGQDEPACLACGGNLGTGEGCDTCYVWSEAVNALRKAGGDL